MPTRPSPPIAFGVKDNNVRVEFSSGDIGEWWPAEYQQNHTIAQLNKGKWHDFIVRIRFKPDNTGLLEVWHRLEGQAEFTQALSLPNVPTLQWSNETEDVSENYRIPYTRTDLARAIHPGYTLSMGFTAASTLRKPAHCTRTTGTAAHRSMPSGPPSNKPHPSNHILFHHDESHPSLPLRGNLRRPFRPRFLLQETRTAAA